LVKAAKSLVKRLVKLQGGSMDGFIAIVYFDEAHTLHHPPSNDSSNWRSPYAALMHILSFISRVRIFFVFLSTNSNLYKFAPTDAHYPSLRVQGPSTLIPPLFELPFDTFAHGFTTQAKKSNKLTLSGVCELKQMAKFGRPM
jgi:hypothetical protein